MNKLLIPISCVMILIFGQFYSVQSQNVCEDGDSHLFKQYESGKVGFINKSGNFVISPKFDNTFSYFTRDMQAASVNKLWGFIDRKGNWIIEPKYGRIVDLNEHLFIVRDKNGTHRLIDWNAETVIASFDEVDVFSSELATVKVSNKWGFIDAFGKIVIEPQFDDAGRFSEGLAPVKKGNKQFYINQSGQIVFQLKNNVDVGGTFKEGLALIAVNNLNGFIDKRGKIVIKPEFGDVSYEFEEGFARFCERNELCGFINKKGEKVIPAKYDYVERFTEGLAHVEISKKHGFINQKGEVVIPIKYDEAGTFECGIAYVEINGEWTYINKNNSPVFPFRKLK